MIIKTNIPTISLNLDNSVNLTFKCGKSILPYIESIKTEEISLEIKPFYPKRSLTQNSYMWSLLNHLAEVLNNTAENIYKELIRDYGVKDYILVKNEAVDELNKRWSSKGIGWFTEVLRKGKVDGTTTIIVYYGSSSYNSKEMSRLVDAVIENCEENNIPTLTRDNFLKLRNEND